MLNNSPWLRDRALEDISDTEADSIAGGQMITVNQLTDVSPAITEPKKKRVMSSKISKSTGLAALSDRVIALVLLFANPFA
ncbi:hypothetical protein QUA82_22770 [Microcoleus sp. F8-D3]